MDTLPSPETPQTPPPEAAEGCESSEQDVQVSVIIPVFGRRASLRRSVQSALCQRDVSLEVLLIDDCSPEDPFRDLGDLAKDQRVRTARLESNRGPSAARNRGVQLARGRYVAFLDSDDTWEPNKLVAQFSCALSAGEPDLFFSTTRYLRMMPGSIAKIMPDRAPWPGERSSDYIYVHGAMAQTSSFFASRELAIQAPFDEELRQFEDHLFFIRATELCTRYAFVPDCLVTYHDEGADDRLSRAKSPAQFNLYEQKAAGVLTRRARLAFRARYRARLMLPDYPVAASMLVIRALVGGALRPRFALGFIRAMIRARQAGNSG